MGKLAGVKYEKDSRGRVKSVTLDMKYHSRFLEDYIDRLKIDEAKKDATFKDWEEIKTELDALHGLNS